ncbi:MAG: 3'-5' exonuclease [Candidatus Pacebacteria bacterium]|nr:3'-5' exonuclease [Candidatus Paceibacterota bacterium]
MYLFFDTETTGLPLNWKAPVEEIDNWPRLVQIAWILFEDNGNELESKESIVRPEGFVIPKEASLVHGITNEIALSKGENLSDVLSLFHMMSREADSIVAHNMSFDEKIIGAEFIRNRMDNHLDRKNRICTMRESTNYCAIKGKYGNKWPTLAELHYKLFETDFEDAHNAATDIKITAKCFWELRKRGAI